jgi:hypothetical protein
MQTAFSCQWGAGMFAALISRFCHRALSFSFGRMAFLLRWLLVLSALAFSGGLPPCCAQTNNPA